MGTSIDAMTDLSVWMPALTTHRMHSATGISSWFQYELVLASIAILFCRLTVKAHDREPLLLRIFFAVSLAILAYRKKPYEIISAMQMLSYIVPVLLKKDSLHLRKRDKALRLGLIPVSAAFSLLLCRFVASGEAFRWTNMFLPNYSKEVLLYLFPIKEIKEAYRAVNAFLPTDLLKHHVHYLLFVTFNIQVGMGYLGIGFLKEEQKRRNQLVRMEFAQTDSIETTKEASDAKGVNGVARDATSSNLKEKQVGASRKFRRGAAPFIFFTVFPYMVQIILFGMMNQFAFTCVHDDIHRAVRLNKLFDHDSHLVAMSEQSATSPGAYASAIDTVVTNTYDIFNRKLFSLPKLLLLPGAMMKHPMLLLQVFPFIFASDYITGRVVTTMTTEIENLEKEVKDIRAVRIKVEQFDMKNAELLRRSGSGALQFTLRKWENLTVEFQKKSVMAALLKRARGFFRGLQRHFIFSALVDCALANLIAVGKIGSAEIFVFSRAIEDFVDLALMRSRAESELATMMTEIERLDELAAVWKESETRSLIPCAVAEDAALGISLKDLEYTRGTAKVKVDFLNLQPGVYALTGANGSGKSTLFRVLMSCETNKNSIDLPSSISLSTLNVLPIDEKPSTDDTCEIDTCTPPVFGTAQITMPSTDVAEISQTFYWPLYTKPIQWIYDTKFDDIPPAERSEMLLRVAQELQSLEFSQLRRDDNSTQESNETASAENVTAPTLSPTEEAFANLMKELEEEKEDWFADLSGGQKSKVELVRKVFLHQSCPNVLLIDETMAPLDPTSKSLVMAKLKNFCRDSVLMVIYHTDVGRGRQLENETEIVECVPSNDFFDHNLHVEDFRLNLRPVC